MITALFLFLVLVRFISLYMLASTCFSSKFFLMLGSAHPQAIKVEVATHLPAMNYKQHDLLVTCECAWCIGCVCDHFAC